jgi:hypothetical protein
MATTIGARESDEVKARSRCAGWTGSERQRQRRREQVCVHELGPRRLLHGLVTRRTRRCTRDWILRRGIPYTIAGANAPADGPERDGRGSLSWCLVHRGRFDRCEARSGKELVCRYCCFGAAAGCFLPWIRGRAWMQTTVPRKKEAGLCKFTCAHAVLALCELCPHRLRVWWAMK